MGTYHANVVAVEQDLFQFGSLITLWSVFTANDATNKLSMRHKLYRHQVYLLTIQSRLPAPYLLKKPTIKSSQSRHSIA
jgi:hypothetical protein